jgi:hypothetical protein
MPIAVEQTQGLVDADLPVGDGSEHRDLWPFGDGLEPVSRAAKPGRKRATPEPGRAISVCSLSKAARYQAPARCCRQDLLMPLECLLAHRIEVGHAASY